MIETTKIYRSEILDLIKSMDEGEKCKIGTYLVVKLENNLFKLDDTIDDNYLELIKDSLREIELIG